MTRPAMSSRIGEFRPPPPSFTKLLILSCGAFFLLVTGVLDLAWPEQAVLGLATVLLAPLLERGSPSYLVTLTLLSVHATFRYGFWRLSSTIHFFTDPGTHRTPSTPSSWAPSCWPRATPPSSSSSASSRPSGPSTARRPPLPANVKLWFAIDVLIPTLNEPLAVVRSTVLAAIHLDRPADRLNVFLLDDGSRDDFRLFAEEVGISYIARSGNLHAKAGNINHALTRLSSPFIAIFDSDHVPTRSFLQLTVGWFPHRTSRPPQAPVPCLPLRSRLGTAISTSALTEPSSLPSPRSSPAFSTHGQHHPHPPDRAAHPAQRHHLRPRRPLHRPLRRPKHVARA